MAEPLVPLYETFPALEAVPGVIHGFTLRAQGIDVNAERAEVLLRLKAPHEAARIAAGLGGHPMVTAEQVHGSNVRRIHGPQPTMIPACDGLMTSVPGVALGIYVADCCAVYLADLRGRAIGIVHSGKKGTEQQIVPIAIRAMAKEFSVAPRDLVVQLGPCIRPPLYEVDIAREIVRQAKDEGAGQVIDCEVNTGAELLRYYSYRVEKGKTGRMLAFAALEHSSRRSANSDGAGV